MAGEDPVEYSSPSLQYKCLWIRAALMRTLKAREPLSGAAYILPSTDGPGTHVTMIKDIPTQGCIKKLQGSIAPHRWGSRGNTIAYTSLDHMGLAISQ